MEQSQEPGAQHWLQSVCVQSWMETCNGAGQRIINSFLFQCQHGYSRWLTRVWKTMFWFPMSDVLMSCVLIIIVFVSTVLNYRRWSPRLKSCCCCAALAQSWSRFNQRLLRKVWLFCHPPATASSVLPRWWSQVCICCPGSPRTLCILIS